MSFNVMTPKARMPNAVRLAFVGYTARAHADQRRPGQPDEAAAGPVRPECLSSLKSLHPKLPCLLEGFGKGPDVQAVRQV